MITTGTTCSSSAFIMYTTAVLSSGTSGKSRSPDGDGLYSSYYDVIITTTVVMS